MKKIILFVCFFESLLFANPSPLGLELNKATFEEVIQKYPNYKTKGLSKFSNGKVIYIEPRNAYPLGFAKVVFIFSQDDILLSTLLDLKETTDIESSLDKKYKLIKSKKSSFDEAIYNSNETEIILYRNDRLIYIHKDLIELYNKVKNEEKIKNIKDNDTKL